MVLLAADCNHLSRDVYFPAPTPIFMEEGLREAVDQGRAPIESKAAGVSGKLNPAKIEVAKAAHAAELTAASQPPPELPPPTQPPINGPQPAIPETLTRGQPTRHYEP